MNRNCLVLNKKKADLIENCSYKLLEFIAVTLIIYSSFLRAVHYDNFQASTLHLKHE